MLKVFKSLLQTIRAKKLSKCGCDVKISKRCSFQGNIEVGNHVVLGFGSYFVSTKATIKIHDYVVFGPNVTIYSGDHQSDILGKHIIEITDRDKNDPDLDQDVVIESGCWIGTRAIILKGVTIGKGSIVGAGSVVTKDIPPYSVYVGVPSSRVFERFNKEEIEEHEKLLDERGVHPDSFLLEY